MDTDCLVNNRIFLVGGGVLLMASVFANIVLCKLYNDKYSITPRNSIEVLGESNMEKRSPLIKIEKCQEVDLTPIVLHKNDNQTSKLNKHRVCASPSAIELELVEMGKSKRMPKNVKIKKNSTGLYDAKSKVSGKDLANQLSRKNNNYSLPQWVVDDYNKNKTVVI